MKKYFLLLVLTMSGSLLYAQNEENDTFELKIIVKNNNTLDDVVGTMELVSKCWDANTINLDEHNINNSYTGSTISSNFKLGWNICWRSNTQNFGLGKYKVTIARGYLIDYFYIDYRTSDIPRNYTGSCDIEFYFNAQNGIIYKNETLTEPVGTDLTIWDLTTLEEIKDGLEPYTPYDFSVSGNVNPELFWQPSSEEDYVTGYAIYRSLVNIYEPAGTFNKIATLLADETSYTDYDLTLGGQNRAYYKITAVNGNRESVPTQTKHIDASPNKRLFKDVAYTYNLAQNYPNPFNPTTKIKYAVAAETNVKISLFDILGKELFILLNENKQPGEYEIEFNGSSLSSGIYYYKMVSGTFQLMRKLVIVK